VVLAELYNAGAHASTGSAIATVILGGFAYLGWMRPTLAGVLLVVFAPLAAFAVVAGSTNLDPASQVILGLLLFAGIPFLSGLLLLFAARAHGQVSVQTALGHSSSSPRRWRTFGVVVLLLPIVAGVVSRFVGDGSGSAAASGATRKCLSLWNDPRNEGQGVVTILANDLAGTPAALVQAKQHGRCEVVLGAIGSSYVSDAYVYQPPKRSYVEKRTLEGPGRASKLPPWNAKLNEDGTLTLGRP